MVRRAESTGFTGQDAIPRNFRDEFENIFFPASLTRGPQDNITVVPALGSHLHTQFEEPHKAVHVIRAAQGTEPEEESSNE